MLSQPSAIRRRRIRRRAILALLLRRPHRHDRILGDPFAEHPRLFAICVFAEEPDARPGASALPHDDGALFLYRRRRHLRDRSSSTAKPIWDPVDLLDAIQQSGGARDRACFLCASRRWRRTSPPTSSRRPTIFRISGPAVISFRTGGLITGFVGILIQPWKLIADPIGLHLHMAGGLFRPARAPSAGSSSSIIS